MVSKKIEEPNAIAIKTLRGVDVKAVPEESEAPSEFRDYSPYLHFWENELSLFHLDRLFYESTESH